MNHATHFKVSHAQIVQETFDDEVVVVNLGAGTYYSLGNSGADIWNSALNGDNVEQIIVTLVSRYDAPRDAIENATLAFLQQLQEEELLASFEYSNSETDAAKNSAAASSNATTRAPFAAPDLQKFTDMQALLMLDPIHEVDEAGWPNVKAISERSPHAPF